MKKRLVADLTDSVQREFVKAVSNGGADIPCPFCDFESSMGEGENVCPNCGKTIEVVVELKLK